MRLGKLTLPLVAGYIACVPVQAIEFNGSRYDVLVGDINGDLVDDIYLLELDRTVIIHGKIVTPVFIPADGPNFSILSNGNDYDAPIVDESVDPDLLTLGTSKAFLYDYDDDGAKDLIIKKFDTTLYNLVVDGDLGGSSAPAILATDINISTVIISDAGIDPIASSLNGNVYHGTLRGKHSVEKDGSFSYIVPIEVPPGINGLQPELALHYNSNSPNEYLGWGWNLGGVAPAIRRCGADHARDGKRSSVNLGDDYRYCFGRQRLVEVSSGEYRTENDAFARILRSGGSERTPATWSVEQKDGTKIFFGEGDAHRDDGQGYPHTWYPSRLQDKHGNYFSYHYEAPRAGVTRLMLIEYTKNDSAMSIYQEVKLEYEDRDDVTERYTAGSKTLIDERISAIQTYSGGNLVREYTLDYEDVDGSSYADPTSGSRIESITECDDYYHCKSPLTFEWNRLSEADLFPETSASDFTLAEHDDIHSSYYQSGSIALTEPVKTGYSPLRRFSLRGDFDGDNKMEIAYWNCQAAMPGQCDHYVVMGKNDSPNYIGSSPTTLELEYVVAGDRHGHYTPTDTFFGGVMDVNGDGLDDYFIASNAHSRGVKFYISDGQNLQPSEAYSLPASELRQQHTLPFVLDQYNFTVSRPWEFYFVFQDINGDGLVDVMKAPPVNAEMDHFQSLGASGEDGIYVALNTGQGFADFTRWGTATDYQTAMQAPVSEFPLTYQPARITKDGVAVPSLADVNGDGLPDILGFLPGVGVEVGLNTGSSFEYQTGWAGWNVPTPYSYTYDVYPDGYLCDPNNGHGLTIPAVSFNSVSDTFRYADVNGDKLTDIVFLQEDGIYVSLSSGTAYLTPQKWSTAINLELVLCGYKTVTFWEAGPAGLPVSGLHKWQILDANKDGRADIGIEITRAGELNSAYSVNYYDIIYSLGSSRAGQGFSAPIRLFEADWYINHDPGGARFSGIEVSENGDLYVQNAMQYPAPARLSNWDNGWGAWGLETGHAYDFGMYKVGIDSHRIKKIETNSAQTLHIEFKEINRSADIYEQDGSHYSTSVSGRSGGLPSVVESKPGTDESGSTAVHASLRTNAVFSTNAAHVSVVKSIKMQGDIQASYDYQYRNYGYHEGGFGTLDFERIYRTETSPALSQEIRNVDEYLQEVGDEDAYLLTTKARSVQCVAGLGTSTKGCPNIDFSGPEYGFRLLSDSRFDWRIKKFSDDIDSYESPHFHPYVMAEQVRTYELNDIYQTAIHTKSRRLSDDFGSSYCPGFGYTNPAFRISNADHLDNYGTPFRVTEIYCDAFGLTGTTSENGDILNDTNNWCLGLVQDAIVRTWSYDVQSNVLDELARNTRFEFDTCRVASETREPDSINDSIWLKKEFSYDNYGHYSSVTETVRDFPNDGINFDSRTHFISTEYDTSGTRTTVTTNPLSQTTTEVSNAKFGSTSYFSDVNGLESMFSYDGFGRLKAQSELGLTTVFDYRSCNECFGYNQEALWYVQQKSQGSTAKRTYYDGLDREVGTRYQGLTGSSIQTGKLYDSFGRLSRSTQPRKNTVWWLLQTEYSYDSLGRVETTAFPNGGVQFTEYSVTASGQYDGAFVVSTTDTLGYDTKRYYDALQREKLIVDALNGEVRHWHDATGNVSRTEVSHSSYSNSIDHQIAFDELGRKIALVDPDIGQINYTYNALGHLVKQSNDEDEVICFEFDQIDRQTRRTEGLSSSGSCGGSSQYWLYDRPGALGLLHTVSGVDTGGRSHIEEYFYNDRQLMTKKLSTINNLGFETLYFYDIYNRFKGMSYPSGFAVENMYNSYGQVHEVYSANTGDLLWEALDSDAYGNLTQVSFGNGTFVDSEFDPLTGLIKSRNADHADQIIQAHEYEFDYEGNLRIRRDNRLGVNFEQGFCYDQLHRLLKIRNGSECSSWETADFTYDHFGNLTSNLGITNYDYTADGDLTYRVRSTSRGNYQYDDAGRITVGPGYTIDYSLFGKPTSMDYSGGHSTSIVYGALQERVQRTDISDLGQTTQTYYVGKDYELIVSGIESEHRHYMGDWGIHVIEGQSNKEYNVYVTRDHIGSVVTKTDDLDPETPVVKYHANEPWGKRQSEAWNGTVYERITSSGYYSNGGFNTDTSLLKDTTYGTSRGFTDHEHLDGVGLIHMNGRVYDPIVSRFLTPDPYIQDPTNSQSFNRYSYVWNNPLRYTDPTGEVVFLALPAIVKGGAWALTAWGAYETAIVTEQTISDYRSGELTGTQVAKNVGIAGAEALIFNRAVAVSRLAPQAIRDKASEWYNAALGKSDKVNGGLNADTPVTGKTTPANEIVETGDVAKKADDFVYRGGSGTPTNLTPRPNDIGGLSGNVNPMPGKNQVIDTSKLDQLCAVCDNPKTGHVSIKPKDMSQMQGWIDSRGSGTTHPLTQELMDAVVDQVKR